MSSWPVQDAKSRFSALLDRCIGEGPQIVTRRGIEAAVLVSMAEWRQLQQSARPTLKELLLAPEPRWEELPIPARASLRLRPPPVLD